MVKKSKFKNTAYGGLARALNIGFTIAASLIFCVVAGRYLDNYMETGPWFTLIFSFLGIFLSGKAIYDGVTKK